MPEFEYTAREASGTQVQGVLSAASEQDALQRLASQSLFPVSVQESVEDARLSTGRSGRVRPAQVATLLTQLSDLLRSGVPLLRSLELLERKASAPGLESVVRNVREDVADGQRLAEAMGRHPKVFGELAVSMVRAGEEGGFLEDVLQRIASFVEHQQELKARVTGAMIYPAFLLGLGTIIVGAMLLFFVPKFQPIFDRMAERGRLPWATTTLMGFSETLRQYWLLLAALAGGLGIWLVNWLRTESGRETWDRLRISSVKVGRKEFGFGPIARSLAIARFCRILGTLLSNGVPLLQSLDIAKDATGNVVLSRAIAGAAENVTAGKSLAGPLRASGEFPEEIVEMVAVGEEANNLEQVLVDVADTMERHTHRALDTFVRLLEPVLLLLMASVILFVAIALMLPILQSSGIF